MTAPPSSSIPATDDKEKSPSPEELYSLSQRNFADDLFNLEFLQKAAAQEEEERLHPSPVFQPPEEPCKEDAETQAEIQFAPLPGFWHNVPRFPLDPFPYELHVRAPSQFAPVFSPRPFPPLFG